MPYFEGASIGSYMMMDDERKRMAEELLTNGYIEFTSEVAKTYFDAMVFSSRNGLYYDRLGKERLEKNDFDVSYSYQEYMDIIDSGGLVDDATLGRQRGVLVNPNIQFDSKKAKPYVGSKIEESSTGSIKK